MITIQFFGRFSSRRRSPPNPLTLEASTHDEASERKSFVFPSRLRRFLQRMRKSRSRDQDMPPAAHIDHAEEETRTDNHPVVIQVTTKVSTDAVLRQSVESVGVHSPSPNQPAQDCNDPNDQADAAALDDSDLHTLSSSSVSGPHQDFNSSDSSSCYFHSEVPSAHENSSDKPSDGEVSEANSAQVLSYSHIQVNHSNAGLPGTQEPEDGLDTDVLEAPLIAFPDLRQTPAIEVTDANGVNPGPNVPPMPPGVFHPIFAARQADRSLDPHQNQPLQFDPNAPSPKDPIIPRELAVQNTPRQTNSETNHYLNLQPVLPAPVGYHRADSDSAYPMNFRSGRFYEQKTRPVIPNLDGLECVGSAYPADFRGAFPPTPQSGPVIPAPNGLHFDVSRPSPLAFTGQPPQASYRGWNQAHHQTPGLDHHAVTPIGNSLLPTPAAEPWANLPDSIQIARPQYPGNDLIPGEIHPILFSPPKVPKEVPTVKHRGITYELHYDIGRGTFGRVVYAKARSDTVNGVVAIKVLDKFQLVFQRVTNIGGYGLRPADVQREASILERASMTGSKFLSPLLASFHDDKKVYFVMKMYSTTLRERLWKMHEQRSVMKIDEIRLDAAQMLLGIEALHRFGIVHCDLKPENILISSSGNLVVADFGVAIKMRPNEKIRGPFGTAEYSAPEVWSEFCPGPADIWSYGAILLQMFIGTHKPYFSPDPEERETYVNVRQVLKHNAGASHDAVTLISSILNAAPPYRPDSTEIKAHRFFAPLAWPLVIDQQYTPVYRPEPPMPLRPTYDDPPPRLKLNQKHVQAIDEMLEEIDNIDLDYRCSDANMKIHMTE